MFEMITGNKYDRMQREAAHHALGTWTIYSIVS